MLKVSCIQINSQNNMAQNIDKICSYIKEAAKNGAEFITLPENAALMPANEEESIKAAISMEDHPALSAFKSAAKDLNIWLLVGSIAVKHENSNKMANRSFLISPKGEVAAYYDKIHLFDVDIENGESHKESSRYEAGEKAVIAKLPFANIGMTICYDLRFPHLYRDLAKKGANIICVPAAFTKKTGEAHWHTLLKARAIETGCFIIAPAQTGTHPANRKTFGHSLIIDPWGKIISEAGTGEEIIYAQIDLKMVEKIRKQLPTINHDRKYKIINL
ncbi:carbon-nitrogen hydrolase family protein [Rickettsiales bacterium]|nr:carbon-nitrogen hydrolase family protein [Rickettsiales bacterium]